MTQYLKHLWRIGIGWSSLGALVVVLAGWWSAPAADEGGYTPSPVRNLALVLKAESKSAKDLEDRKKLLEDLTSPKALRNADLRAALALDAWKDQDKNEAVAAIDDPVRRALIKRFKEWVADIFKQPNQLDAKLAAVTMLGEMGTTIRSAGPRKTSLAAELAPDLAAVMTSPEPPLRQAAARAMGKINPPAKLATEALGSMLTSGDTNDRRAAADGLASMLRVLLPLATSKSSSPTVEVERADSLQTGELVARTAGQGLRFGDPVVRQSCLDALQQAASLLGELGEVLARDFPPPNRPATTEEQSKIEEYRKSVAATMKEVQPLADALNSQVEGVTQSLGDARYPEVRRRAGATLIEMGVARQRLLRKDVNPRPAVPLPVAPGSAKRSGPAVVQVVALQPVAVAEQADAKNEEDPLRPGLEKAINPLIARLRDPDVRVRLEALEALNTMGQLAAPAVPAAITVLDTDPCHFVRWAAVRLMGKIGAPADPKLLQSAVQTLARHLLDPDLDVRLAIGTTLSIYGNAAAAAVPTLARAIAYGDPLIRAYLANWPPAYGWAHSIREYSDAEMRVAAIRTLQNMARETTATAVAALTIALADPDARVRRVAAEALGQIGPLARSAEPALTKALSDPEPEVRRAASDALLSVTEK